MNRHVAYKHLSMVLAALKNRPFRDLEALIGNRQSERVRVDSGQELIIDVLVEREDHDENTVRITATADAASTFRLERLEERIIVSRDAT